MITHLYDPNARKKPTNLSLNIDLLRQVRDLRINLSKDLRAVPGPNAFKQALL